MTPPAAGDHVRLRHAEVLDEWARLAVALREESLVAAVDAVGEVLVRCLAEGHGILVAGNGGSAAMASHVAAEFAGRCVRDRRPLPAMSLADSSTAVTAVANDFGFDEVFARGVAAHGHPGDVLLVMTTSGRSRNVQRALEVARERGLMTVALTGGSGGPVLEPLADHVLVAPADSTPRIQEVHLAWTHAWSEAVDLTWAERG
jgi:D-sedoheptulose 7-phosphate isomerase